MKKIKLMLIRMFCEVAQEEDGYLKYYGRQGLTKVYK